MGTRDLRFRIIGDASGAKGAFQEVSVGAAQAAAGLQHADVSANTVGKTFSRSGKLFKATGKVMKNSGLDALTAGSAFASIIPQASGLAGGLGAVTIGADALSTTVGSLGAYALPVMGAAAIAAGAAFIILHDDVQTATAALEGQRDANEQVIRTHRDLAAAFEEQRQGIRDAESASLSVVEAQNRLGEANRRVQETLHAGGKESLAYRDALVKEEAANRKVSDALKDHGRNSLEYRQALIAQEKAQQKVTDTEKAGGKSSADYKDAVIAQKRAQMELGDVRREAIRNAQDFITKTKDTSKAIASETKQTKEAADAARLRQRFLGTLITGKQSAAVSREIAKALNAESKAAQAASAKHQANAKSARAMADAIGTATPQARALHSQLEALARQELNLSGAVAAMNSLRSAAGSAAAAVRSVAAAIAATPSSPGRSTGGGGNPGIPSGKRSASKSADEFMADARARGFAPRRGETNPLSFTDLAGNPIDARHRGDTTEDRIVGDTARDKARASGVTNPDKLEAISQRAVDQRRKDDLKKDLDDVKRARRKLHGRIASLRKQLASQRASRQKAKKDDQGKWDTRIQDTIGRIRGLWDEDRALRRTAAEIQSEAAGYGYDIGVLDVAIGQMPDAAPDDTVDTTPPSAADFAEAAVAEAALTPGTEDDLAAARNLEAVTLADLDAARASGDPRRVTAAASAYAAAKAAREQIEATNTNTDALNANTDALRGFGGSNVISYGGQDFVLRNLAPPSSDRLTGMEVGV